MTARILAISDVADILRITPAEARDMVARREIPALMVVAGDSLISEGALRELIEGPWRVEPGGLS